MTEKILLVDDELPVLDGYRRQIGRKYRVHCALGGEEALELMKTEGPFAVIVSDMKMPGMDGVTFLAKAREMAPDTVRVMLTGTEEKNAAQAVNEGSIFRFLSKPCQTDLLELTIEAAISRYRLVTSERALLSSTLTGAVKVLTEVLAAARPVAFGRTDRIRMLVRKLAKELIPQQLWRAELAALLSQVGCVGLPEDILTKAYAGKQLVPKDAGLFREHPRVGANLVKHVPRLEQVAEIILQQSKNFDGSGYPDDSIAGDQIPMEARILKVAIDIDALTLAGSNLPDALAEMGTRAGAYDKAVLQVVERWVKDKENLGTSA